MAVVFGRPVRQPLLSGVRLPEGVAPVLPDGVRVPYVLDAGAGVFAELLAGVRVCVGATFRAMRARAAAGRALTRCVGRRRP